MSADIVKAEVLEGQKLIVLDDDAARKTHIAEGGEKVDVGADQIERLVDAGVVKKIGR